MSKRIRNKEKDKITHAIYMEKNKEKMKTWYKNYNKKKYPQTKKIQKKMLFDLKINGCAICGYNKCIYALDFHHVNPRTKKFNITRQQMTSQSDKRLKEEINKCILLCSNCHDEIEWGI